MLALADIPFDFRPLGDRPSGMWRRPRQFGFLNRVGTIPLADSELLQTSLYLPLAVREAADAYEVIAVLHPDFLARSPVRPDGRWVPPYMPIALRYLPLRRSHCTADKVSSLEIAQDLDAGADAIAAPFFADDGRMHPDFAAAMSHFDRLEVGKARLAKAAASLVAADILVKLTSTSSEALAPDVDLLVIDPRRWRQLTPPRIAALAADGFLALDLATACCFSARLWAPHLVPQVADGGQHDADASLVPFEQRGHGAFPIELRIDDSSLFSFDAYASATAEQPGDTR
ncbi:SapC family protein [Vineibacter terrae]|uniref:SapC family protein n=1 Tax=Vineibacter terrae TaxID=2586908 RepID=UPI002E36382B|nr:SapC family protein [Vineibacter terrae]HEX2885982.1 SapC family protein [Vineibacter terrae]